MNNTIKRIAYLLDTDESKITIAAEDETQCFVVIDNYKNYIYSKEDDTVLDLDTVTGKIRLSEQYLTPEEKEEYYKENEKLIGFTLKKINRLDGIEQEELHDICIFGFAKALNSYNKKMGIKFSTYCVRCMLNEMYYYLRKEQKRVLNNVSFDKTISSDENKSLTFGDLVSETPNKHARSVEEEVLNSELRGVLFQCMSILSEDERHLIIYRYGLDHNIIKTQNEVAKDLGMSQANVSKLENLCLAKMRDVIKNYNYDYSPKDKILIHSCDKKFDTGANEKILYLDKDDENNIELIAAEKLRIDLGEIDTVEKTDDRNEYKVTFKTNKRIYAIVNNVSGYVKLCKYKLTKEEMFMSIILNIPFLSYNMSRDVLNTSKYNITYSKRKLKGEIKKLSDTEQYIIKYFYGLGNKEYKTMEIISDDLGISLYELMEIRKEMLKKLKKEFVKKKLRK